MPKLKLQYFGHLMQTADSLEKSLMLGKIEGTRRRGNQRMRWLDGITTAMDRSLGSISDSSSQRIAASQHHIGFSLDVTSEDSHLNPSPSSYNQHKL